MTNKEANFSSILPRTLKEMWFFDVAAFLRPLHIIKPHDLDWSTGITAAFTRNLCNHVTVKPKV